MAWITSWVNSFGTVLTPMMAVGRNSFTASTKVATGARSWANGVWKAARSLREVTTRPLMSNSALRRRAAARSMPSPAIDRLISSAMPVAADPAPRNRKRCSASLPPVRRNAAKMPASATPAVPWMSSLKVQILSL